MSRHSLTSECSENAYLDVPWTANGATHKRGETDAISPRRTNEIGEVKIAAVLTPTKKRVTLSRVLLSF